MQRTPEPDELMDDDAQAEAYAVADFASVNQAFALAFLTRFPDFRSGTIADLGCGPADIPIRLARMLPEVKLCAIDGSAAMLRHAERAIQTEYLERRVRLEHRMLPTGLPDRFDAIISNSLLHHLPDPSVLWREIARLAKTNAPVFVVDLMRPETPQAAQAIVDQYAAGEREVLRRDFYNSLCAAFTIDEVRAQLAAVALPLRVEATSDRHMTISGRAP